MILPNFVFHFCHLPMGASLSVLKTSCIWHPIRISWDREFWFQESYYFWNIFPLKPGTTLFQVGLASVNWRINIMPASSWPNNKEQRKIRKISTKKGNFRTWKEISCVKYDYSFWIGDIFFVSYPRLLLQWKELFLLLLKYVFQSRE